VRLNLFALHTSSGNHKHYPSQQCLYPSTPVELQNKLLALPPPLLSHVPISTVPDAYVPPLLPNASVHSIPIISKPAAGAPPTIPPSAFIPQVSQGMHSTYSLPIQATLSRMPLAIDFTPRPRAVSLQVPSTTNAVPPYHGAYYQVPPYSNVNAGPQGTSYQVPLGPNINTAPQSVPYQTTPMTSAMHYLPPVNQDAS
jgi:hypothetical protein